MERKISLKGKPDRNYTVKPSMRPGGYPGSPPVAPPHGSYGVGGYPSGATPAQHHNMPHQQGSNSNENIQQAYQISDKMPANLPLGYAPGQNFLSILRAGSSQTELKYFC